MKPVKLRGKLSTEQRTAILQRMEEHDRQRAENPMEEIESPQSRVGRGGASSMPPQHRYSIEMSGPGEWKP